MPDPKYLNLTHLQLIKIDRWPKPRSGWSAFTHKLRVWWRKRCDGAGQ